MALKAAVEALIHSQVWPDGIILRLAEAKDFELLEAINAEAMCSVGAEVYGVQDKAFFTEVSTNGAAIVLILRDGIAQGYSIVGAAARMTRLFANEHDRGLMFGTALRKGLRGLGLQRRMIALRKTALSHCGFSAAKAFVSPANLRSLRNLLAEDCRIVSHDSTYYSCDRFIVEAQLNQRHDLEKGAPSRRVPLGPDKDLQPHVALLSKGWHGVSLDDASGEAVLVYNRPD